MAQRRFFTHLQQLKPGIRIYLPEEESLHITKVLRKVAGDKIEVFNGTEAYLAEIYTAAKKSVRVKLLERIDVISEFTPKLVPITLFIALIKLSSLEVALQKSVELGVEQVFVFESSHAQKIRDQFLYKLPRFNKLMLEACKQSKNMQIPQVGEPLSFDAMANQLASFDQKLIFTTEREARPLSEFNFGKPASFAYVIGPEGGFSEKELDNVIVAGAEPASFGPLILRAETAAIATLSALQTRINQF